MTTLHVSKLQTVLQTAVRAGHHEESATIAGQDLVFCSLEPDVYGEIMQEVDDLPEMEYVPAYQKEHVCRSIVEINGQDLRGVDFIEEEVEGSDGKPSTIKVETHQWLDDNVVKTWSREMVYVAFRKVMDAVAGAAERSNEGVSFRIESEPDEDKLHRLLGDVAAVSVELPDDMREAIFKEHGLLEATSKEELESINEQAKKWAAAEAAALEQLETEASTAEQQTPRQPGPTNHTPPPAPEQVAPASPPRAPQQLVDAQEQEDQEEHQEDQEGPVLSQPVARPKTPREMLQNREPMNRTAIKPPVPDSLQPSGQAPVVNPRKGRPDPSEIGELPDKSRAAQYAALESAAAAEGIPVLAGVELGKKPHAYDLSGPSPLLEERIDTAIHKTDLRVNRPPVAGRNKKFVNPHGQGLNPRNRKG